MKPIAWISGIIIAALCAFIIVDGSSEPTKISYAETRRSVDALDGRDGIEFIKLQDWKVVSEPGTTLEKRLRELLHLKQRRSYSRIEAQQFRDSAGGFSIEIHDKGREGADVTIYADSGFMKPSKRTRDHLITLFPHAHLVTDSQDQ